MGIEPIQDEFTGKGNTSWRYMQRRLKKGLCARCKNPIPEDRRGKMTCGCDKVKRGLA